MRVFKTKEFARAARKEKVVEDELRKTIKRTLGGTIDAELGAFLIKQRISQGQGGRWGSHRAVIVFRARDRLVFVHLFGKSEKANLSTNEERSYKKAAKVIVGLTEGQVQALVQSGEWIEIENGDEATPLSK
ncbi:type II toxin-antitoxin system RelE/ParE family toxin [Jiella sonneratiae]|uniref:Type II toxin-antitoxin system RelE/ParE family toxin n=1 Tax=Jiella sonneratiae TaxID=2816856 RepID=A0ABS3J6G8_9HYPH|nr:type II toxin-antitoxin system RelE/ParE family toxin [Jiella sonneratiae]MBO0905259.1 type II toxin-antitoxin system RelE/ParE family toxin [Jiella sonneratiae]